MIGLLAKRGSYAIDSLVACSGLPLVAVDVRTLGLPSDHCQYGLPTAGSGDVAIVCSGWWHELRQRRLDAVESVLLPLKQRFGRLVGLDHADPFQLDFSNDVMTVMDAVLKVNGIYHDTDLYNYVVGAPTPDGRWLEKSEPIATRYTDANLKKLNLSIPCFFSMNPEVRAAARRFYRQSAVSRAIRAVSDGVVQRLARPLRRDDEPPYAVHFFGALTHIQRATAVGRLKESGLKWIGGITDVPPFVTGLRGVGMSRLSPAEREELVGRLSNEGLMTPRLGRVGYQLSMRDCKAVLSITGYGELCFRMVEAWMGRRVLVCQDVSHARTLFPLEAGRNVVYCRPDLSDLFDVLEDIDRHWRHYIDIAEQGYSDWTRWCGEASTVMRKGFAPLYADS